jgi:WD40 repeat protein
MATTPSNRLKLTPSNSPFLQRPARSPMRGRPAYESRLSLKRVVGTTCCSPTGFDAVQSSFAYIAGGAVVVVDVNQGRYSQRFYRARPTAIPLYATSPREKAPCTPTSTPKANDSRNRVAASLRDSPYSNLDFAESPSSKTWTSRERIKAATCLALSRDAKFLAVGETGYAPRVLIFSLQDSSSDLPLVSISEHTFGVKAVAWSHDTRFLASLGAATDGFLYVWRIDSRTGAAKLFQQNRCTSYVRGMIWMGNTLITLGVRHVKAWKVDDGPSVSPVKQKFAADLISTSQSQQKALPGRNILLGSLIDATFTCAAVVDEGRAIICTEAGDVCLLEDDGKQMKLQKALRLDFPVSSITIRDLTAYVGGKEGQFATLNVTSVVDFRSDCIISVAGAPTGLVAMGFLKDNLVTIDSKHSINIWDSDYVPGRSAADSAHIPIPGHGEPIVGVQLLEKPNTSGAAFMTWSGSGQLIHWDLDGQIKSTIVVPIHQDPIGDADMENQLTVVRTTKSGKLLVAADKLGVLKVMEFESKKCILDTKAHSCDCQDVTVFESDSKLIMASSGRDRTTQLFHRPRGGKIEHFQTLEFAAKVVKVLITEDKIFTCSLDRTLQVHDLVSREDDPDVIAAIPSRVISLKASPTCMAMGADEKSIFVSLLDRSVCQYDVTTGRLISSFKCVDESGTESAVLDSLILGQAPAKDFLLGVSNTDKSVRIYDAQGGGFLDREWGHTEAINGIAMVEDDEGRRVVSVGSDGTIMVWALDLQEAGCGSMSRDPSPVKESSTGRPPLRRVLSKAELAEFQRPSPSAGRRSPPRVVQRRPSKQILQATTKAPILSTSTTISTSPTSTIVEDATPSRRTSSARSGSGSPPSSPKSRPTRRPSLPALGVSARKKSSPNLRAFGTLNMATEQACRTLRAYRKKLTSTEPISQQVLTELDQELRLTASALGDRAVRSKAMDESMLSGLLDQYSERIVSLLDEKLRLSLVPKAMGRDVDVDGLENRRPRTASGETNSTS